MSYFKWGIGLLGVYIGGLPGGLIGYWIGSKIDKKSSKANIHTIESESGTLKDTDISLVLLIAAVLKADNTVRQSELNAVKRFLANNYNEEDGKKILSLLRDLVKPTTTIDLEPACDVIREHTDYTTRYHMTDFLFRLATADGEFDGTEIKVIQTIARHLRITQGDYTSMFTRHTRGYSDYQNTYSQWRKGSSGSQYGQQNSSYSSSQSSAGSASNPYKTLGLDSSATDEEVKKAYRRMAMRYHPDKVEGLGEEMKKNATEQFRAINEAYETIKRERGIK